MKHHCKCYLVYDSVVSGIESHVICVDNSTRWKSYTDFNIARAYPYLNNKIGLPGLMEKCDTYIFFHKSHNAKILSTHI